MRNVLHIRDGVRRWMQWGLCPTLAALFLAAATSPTPARGSACPCDCNTDGRVSVAEIIAAVNVALKSASHTTCPQADLNGDGTVSVNELVAGVNAALSGCAPSPRPTQTALPSPTPGPPGQRPPNNPEELLAWLEEGRYMHWSPESAVHSSGGPHFGRVRTWVNDILLESLTAGRREHPTGAAAVKELYGSGNEVEGWSVSHKVQADSSGGRGWYWYERFAGTVYGEGLGDPTCTGCHGRDFGSFRSKDFILAPFPLQ